MMNLGVTSALLGVVSSLSFYDKPSKIFNPVVIDGHKSFISSVEKSTMKVCFFYLVFLYFYFFFLCFFFLYVYLFLLFSYFFILTFSSSLFPYFTHFFSHFHFPLHFLTY